jgi:NAD(P)-dependent dehydrogenase (short-subunit alcohol dehydrogenase family)
LTSAELVVYLNMGRENDFAGKTIALTGGASGIGLATAQAIHSRAGSVSIADVDQEALDNAAKTIGKDDRVLLTKVDVSDRKQVDQWIEATVKHFGGLHGAANCAGVIGKHHGTRTIEELEDEQWDLIMRVNLTGMMYALRAQLKAIRGPGSIVCVSSVQGLMGFAKHVSLSNERKRTARRKLPAE